MEWLKEISPDELPEPYRHLCGIIGLEHTLALAREYQGSMVYLPKLDSTVKLIRDRKIREEFSGANHRLLALKYGLSESWVRQIVAGCDDGHTGRSGHREEQMTILDYL